MPFFTAQSSSHPAFCRGFSAVLVALALLGSASLALAQDDEAAEDDGEHSEVRYVELGAPFVVNYGPYSSRPSYFKVSVTVRCEDKASSLLVKSNLDLLRDRLVLAFSAQSRQTLQAADAQQNLRATTLALIQQTMQEEFAQDIISDVLFTSFILQ